MKDAPFDPRISRNKRRRRTWIAVIVTLVITAAWIFRPHGHADKSLIDPRLRALQKPYQFVSSDLLFDGGSVRINITDAAGRTEHFFIPNREGWKTVYIVELPHTGNDGIPVSDHAATIQELSAILADHCDDIWDYGNLYLMTRRLGDRIKSEGYARWLKLRDWWDGFKW